MSGRDSALPQVRELIRTLPTASAVFDRNMRYLAANERWREAYRLGDQPLEGRSHYEVFPEIDEVWKGAHRRCLEGATEHREADPFPRADGSVDYVDGVLAPWYEPGGAIGGIVMHTEVVTERVQMQMRFDEEQAFIQALVDKSPIGLNLCQMDGLWLESNPAFLAIIGYSAEEADGGLTYWELTPREYDDAEKEQLQSLELHGRYGPYEKEFIRKDGSRVPVRLNGFIIERNGQQYIWSLIEDLSDQRVLESKLQAERLKAIQAAKLASIGEIAAGIAHEINNPLQIIEGFAYGIQEAIAAGEMPSSKSVSAIRNATDRAARIVRGLRTFSRHDSSEVSLHPIGDLVDEALALTAQRIRNHGVDLTVDVRSRRRVRVSALEITQVLINLLNNAFDAVSADHGAIRLVVEDEGEHIAIRVLDSGPGVPEELLKRIFEPFVTSKAPGQGTGLGLSISRNIVDGLGGRLSYEPEEGRSCFVVRLPVGVPVGVEP